MMFHLINFSGVRYGSGWLRIVPMPILFLVASQVSCAQVRNDLDAQETSTETSPVIIISGQIIITGGSELLELLMSPQEVYQRYARQWNLIPERDTEILALTTAECDSNENSQYRWKDCKELVRTRRECAHASMSAVGTLVALAICLDLYQTSTLMRATCMSALTGVQRQTIPKRPETPNRQM
jgi:hypothetical protein